jgi:adenine deaminase
MIESSKAIPMKVFYGCPSCVPATNFETSGATLGPKEVRELMFRPDIHFLAEFMNYPGVVNRDAGCMAKIQSSIDAKKPIDGHAPKLMGPDLDKYISAGISTDHECSLYEEAEEKIKKGMKIIVREGSAAHNLAVLYPLIDKYPNQVMLCTDDCHPDDLTTKGHIDHVVRMALSLGCKLFNVLRAATINAVQHYKLPVGLLRIGDPADFIMVNNLKDLKVIKTFIDGNLVFDANKQMFPFVKPRIVNNFGIGPISISDISVPANDEKIKVIQVIDKELITHKVIETAKINENKEIVADIEKDILKIICVNRYFKAKPTVGFIKGYGLKSGAIAMSIAHDSHNILCVGATDLEIVKAINLIIQSKGGVSGVGLGKELILPLPIAGLMSDLPALEVGKKYEALQQLAKDLGSKVSTPFPTLSFMALTVIPELKISDLGLFDVTTFKGCSVYGEH